MCGLWSDIQVPLVDGNPSRETNEKHPCKTNEYPLERSKQGTTVFSCEQMKKPMFGWVI